MLQSLDTLIAFVVIVTLASLFVTILVQMCSAALSLRGKNLANALALTFQTIDPALGEKAHQLADRILSDPLLSDSTRTQKDKAPAAPAEQRKTPWHFANPFGAMALATAIRPEEVYAALRKLAESPAPPNTPNELGSAAEKVLAALVTPQDRATAVRQALAAFSDIADTVVDAPLKQKILAAVSLTSATLIVEVDAARAKFDAWFSSAQDRAQQWFQLHTRGLTIGASVLIALVFQLDAVDIFHYVSTNAAGRAALVAGADRVIKEADGILDAKGGLIKRIADAWNAGTNHAALKLENLAGITHTGQLEEALVQLYETKGHPSFKTVKDLDDAFQQTVAAATETYYKQQRQKLDDLGKGVSASGFDLVPVRFWRWPADPGGDCWANLKNVMPHLFGILLFAALLTLGAPYWYNLLKNLASLRPALAQLIGKEETSKPTQG
jgi:hypothetical protein